MAKAKAPAAQKIDPDTLKKLRAEIDADDRELFEKYEKALEAKRKEKLSAYLDPLETEAATLQKTIDDATKRLAEIEDEKTMITGERKNKIKPTKSAGAGKRERRSPEQLKADAEKVLDWMKKHPGEKSGAIQEGSGVVIKSPKNPKTLVEEYIEGVKVQAEGNKASTTYTVE